MGGDEGWGGWGKKVANELKLGFCGNINFNAETLYVGDSPRLARDLAVLERDYEEVGAESAAGEEDIDEEY